MFRMTSLRWLLACLLWITASADGTARAQTDLPAICEAAALEASQASGVPLSVLRAISLTETGRKSNGKFRPWPWTVNMEGTGKWFDTEDAARAYVYDHFKTGARSFDVGCFQINYKWHHKNFTSIEQMFEPRANAMYAARFLTDLYRETGSWTKAAGAYHSRNPEFADRYAARFETLRAKFLQGDRPAGPESQMYAAADGWSGEYPAGVADDLQSGGQMAGGDIPDVPELVLARLISESVPEAPRVNTYPLLQASAGSAGMGSLVPMAPGAAGASLFAAP